MGLFSPIGADGVQILVLNARAIEKKLELYSLFDNQAPTTVIGNSSRIRQVLLNLVSNAITFTDQGEVVIHVGIAQHDGMTLRLEVKDTGIGIAKEKQSDIFKPFVTIPSETSSHRNPGTGLGLDIVNRSVALMNGILGISSAPGIGSTFWLELPCEIAASPGDNAAEELVDNNKTSALQGTVLLVDDNATNLMLGRMILQSMSVEADTASSGEEAIERTREADYDLVLMDINMPGMDGFETTRRIRSFKDAKTLPIVALSAYTSAAEIELSKECGMNGYLTKPIERDEIRTALRQWLPGSDDIDSTDLPAAPVVGSSKVDQTVLDDLARQIGNENLLLVTDKFLQEVQIRWLTLENAESAEQIAREAHTLSSTCRSFGLSYVADKLSELESTTRISELPTARSNLAEISDELKKGTRALQAAVNTLG